MNSSKVKDLVNRNPKIYYTVMLVLSFIDLIFGITSMACNDLAVQILSLTSSLATLCGLIVGYILKINDKKTNSTAILSSVDVLVGIISIIFVLNSLRIISGLAGGVVGYKVVRTLVQTEKFKKIFSSVKPKLYKIMLRILPSIVFSFIDKIKNKIKGDRFMKQFKKFLNAFASIFKNNVFTISGTALVGVTGALSATWAVKHILSTNLLPVWAAYIVGILICALVYGFIEFTVIKYGIENGTQVKLRKGLKTILALIGADEIVAKIDEIESKALAKKAAEEEAKRIEEEKQAERLRIEAEKRLAAEKEAMAAIEREALARIKQEEEAKIKAEQEAKARAEAEAKAAAEEEAKKAHEAQVLAMMDILRAKK